MMSLYSGPKELPRKGWHKSVSCWCYGWHNKRSRLYLFSTTMPKPPQDYQVVVSHHHHKEDKSHCTSCGSGSSRWRRSYWIFFCIPIHHRGECICVLQCTWWHSLLVSQWWWQQCGCLHQKQWAGVLGWRMDLLYGLLGHVFLWRLLLVPTHDPWPHQEILARHSTLICQHHLLPHHLPVPQSLPLPILPISPSI